MMDYFNRALNNTLTNEGGFVDDHRDPGGRTKYGISQRAYPDLDIQRLTLATARDIYFRDYWTRAGCDRITDGPIAVKLFDLAVNVGPSRAVRFLQRAANHLGAALSVDGQTGPLTAAFVNAYRHSAALLMALRIEAGNHYIELERPRYLAGWLARLARD